MNEQNSSFKVNIEVETKGLYLKFKTDRNFCGILIMVPTLFTCWLHASIINVCPFFVCLFFLFFSNHTSRVDEGA